MPQERHAREMGQRRRQHDDHAGALATAQTNAEKDRRALCLERWPGILAAMKALVGAYNEGAGQPLVTASEHPEADGPAVTIASHGSARRAITVAVDGDALVVQTDRAAGLHGRVRRIDCSRSDMGTAAYLLQDWMDQL